MDSSNLTRGQLRQVMDCIRPMVVYLDGLERRMEKRDFPDDDVLFLRVVQAHRAMGDLLMGLHYASFRPGTVWRMD